MKSFSRNMELIYTLSFTDLKLKYQNSKLGMLWSFLKPLLQFAVYYMVFVNILKTDTSPEYPMKLFLGVLFWNLFAEGTSNGLIAYLGKKSIVTKIKIKKELIPVSAYCTAFFNYILNMLIFNIIYLLNNGIDAVGPLIKGIPMMLIMYITFSIFVISLDVILATMNVLFRDVQTVWELVLMYGVFLTPIIYPISIDEKFLKIYYFLNPIAYPLENIKSVFFNSTEEILSNSEYTVAYMLSLILWAILAFMVNETLKNKVGDYI